jgi:hypothetical protein
MATYVELAKLGAIGVSVACLILSFRWNEQVTRLAAALSPERLRTLTTHARWTMAFAAGCLIIALIAEVLGRRPIPTRLSVDIVPDDLDRTTKQLKLLKEVPEPVRIKLAGDSKPIVFTLGTGYVVVGEGSTLSVDVHAMLTAILTEEEIAIGERKARTGEGGIAVPQP